MLPASRLFGRISQKGPNKKWSGQTVLRPNFGRFCTKSAKNGPNFIKKKFTLLLSSLFLVKYKKYCNFPTHTDENSPDSFKMGKLRGDRFVFLSGRIFSSGRCEKLWTEMATLLVKLWIFFQGNTGIRNTLRCAAVMSVPPGPENPWSPSLAKTKRKDGKQLEIN